MPTALLDTGPLVAYLYPRDAHHGWAIEQFAQLDAPFRTCEPVITEACFVLARSRFSATRVLAAVDEGLIEVDFSLVEHVGVLRGFIERYANVPMSLADACLVRMAEMTGLPICTLDNDFAIYRAHGNRRLELISPDLRPGLHEP